MFTIIVLTVILIVTLIAFAIPPHYPGIVGVVVFAVFWALFSVTIVGPRDIGVVQTFGKVEERTLPSGLHWIKPWQNVTDIDGAYRTMKFVGAPGSEGLDCIGARISDLTVSCVSVVVRYRHKPDYADSLFADYRGVEEKGDYEDINEAIADTLVRTKLSTSVGTVFQPFDPLLSANKAPNLDALSADVKSALVSRVVEIDVESIDVTFIRNSPQTEERIDRLGQEVARTREAAQQIITNEKIAEANRVLSGSVNDSPAVITSRCYDLVAEAIERKYRLPANFACWPGSGGAIVLPQSTE